MSYLSIWKDKRFTALYLGTSLGRCAQYMFDATLVIYITQALHNPRLAGLSIFFATVPGLILSPLSGGFLANKNQSFWMGMDFLLKALVCIGLASLGSSAGTSMICLLTFIFSLSSAASMVTLRNYIAGQCASSLKGFANGLDAISTGLADILGPAAAGLTCTIWNGTIALYTVGAIYLTAVIVTIYAGSMSALNKHSPSKTSEMNIDIVSQSISYMLKHPRLRNITIVYFVYQMTLGMITILLPEVITFSHIIPAWIGICWSIAGITGIIAAFLAGYLSSYSGDRFLFISGIGIAFISTLILLGGVSFPKLYPLELLGGIFVLLGLSIGFSDVGILGLRQIFLPATSASAILAVSYSLNMAGFPAGTFLLGLISHLSLTFQITVTLIVISSSFLLSFRNKHK